MQARFKRLADRDDVRVYGEQPISKMGRRFWYTTYADAVSELTDDLKILEETPTPQYGRRFWYRTYDDVISTLADRIELVAAEQGSSDSTVVVENYLGEEEARKRRREFMRERLAEAFDE